MVYLLVQDCEIVIETTRKKDCLEISKKYPNANYRFLVVTGEHSLKGGVLK